ncbi:MAG: hypothetical protein HY430_03535, partial [Candidatus Levybacteria bacterium]|nr:hypothetical protein [Candidatus Levybacteria bacterium]
MHPPKLLLPVVLIFFFGLFYFAFPKAATAQCAGVTVACDWTVRTCTPTGCTPGIDDPCTCSDSCGTPEGNTTIVQCSTVSQFYCTNPCTSHGDCVVGGSCAPLGGGGGGGYPGQYTYQYEYEGEPDFDVTGISFYNSSGQQRTTKKFDPGESIYLRVGITNIGDGYPCCASRTAVYKHKPNPVGVGQASDIPMYIDSTSSWPPGFQAFYESWSGGVRDDQYTTSSFKQWAPNNTYTLR